MREPALRLKWLDKLKAVLRSYPPDADGVRFQEVGEMSKEVEGANRPPALAVSSR
jgi:hypothetical protein